MRRPGIALALAAGWFAGNALAGDAFLDPDAAFRLRARALDARQLQLHLEIAPAYHLYADRFAIQVLPAGTTRASLQVPPGATAFDPTLGREVETLRGAVDVMARFEPAPVQPLQFTLRYQGCADEGLCYPPSEHRFRLAPDAHGVPALSEVADTTEARARSEAGERDQHDLRELRDRRDPPGERSDTPSGPRQAVPEQATPHNAAVPDAEPIARVLRARSLPAVAGVFWLAGILLSMTPCVLPMLPILMSIIVGRGAGASRGRKFGLAASFTLGMALLYTAVGVAAGLAGEGLAAWMQNAWVLGAFAMLLALLALSMFGAFEVALPNAWQTRLTRWSARLPGGNHGAVMAMGALSALVVGPCVAPPLAGALVYIGRTHDVWTGGVALFSLAVGLCLPLLLTGLSAGALLPRSGAWMVRVKHLFGFVLLIVAIWIASPVMPPWAVMAAAALLMFAMAAYLLDGAGHARRSVADAALTAAAAALAVGGVIEVGGVASGGRDPWQPLAHLARAPMAAVPGLSAPLFAGVTSVAALETEIRRSQRPVLLDVYADWCSSCKELEALTLHDDAVQRRLAGFTLLRADVTANSPEQRELLRRFGLFGPPAVLFFRAAGDELPASRVIGFLDADEFGRRLETVAQAR